MLRSFAGSGGKSPTKVVIGDQSGGCGSKGRRITGRNEHAAFAVLDDLRKPANSERDRRNSEGHRVYHGRAQSLRSGWMPQQIKARNRVMNLRYEARVERLESGGGSLAFTLAAEQHEAGSRENFSGKLARNRRDCIESLFTRHGSNHSADDDVSRPTTLTPPVARLPHLRCRDAGIHNLDSLGSDAGSDHCVSHGFGDRDESIDPPTVFKPHPLRWKRNASSDYETRLPPENLRQHRNGVGARVMRVNNVGAPLARDGPQLTCAAHIPLASQRQAISGQTGAFGALHEGRPGGGDDERPITAIV